MNNKERLIKGLKMFALFIYILCMIASSMNTVNTMKGGAIFGIIAFCGGVYFLAEYVIANKKKDEKEEREKDE